MVRFISFRELAAYLFTDIQGYLGNDEIVLDVSVPNSSSYFSDHEMTVQIRTPEKMIEKGLEIDGELSEHYDNDKTGRDIRIKIPPFRDKRSKRIHLFLKRSEVDGT